MPTATFSGTYTLNNGEDYATGTVAITPYGGATVTATLDANGSYSETIPLILTSVGGVWVNDVGAIVTSAPASGVQVIPPGGTVDRGKVRVVETITGKAAVTTEFEALDGAIINTGRDVGTVLGGAAAPATTPWIVELDAQGFSAQTNWNQQLQNYLHMYPGYNQSLGGQDAELGWDVVLGAGTWTIQLVYNKSTNTGIFSVRIDDVEVGTVDSYAAAAAANFISSVTGVVVASTGKKRVSLKMATKHASSSSFIGILQHARLIRTA
jgi:hypothetical protein